MKIERVSLQSLAPDLGEYAAVRSCAPIAFYMLLKAYGYLGEHPMTAAAYVGNVNRPHLLTAANDWSRPALSAAARLQFNAPVISWQLNGKAINGTNDIELMKRAGYLKTDLEIEYFHQHIEHKSVEEIVRAGHPMIVTMKPGLGSPENKNIHAVIVSAWDDDGVTVIDPDDRNPKTRFDAAYIEDFISYRGGGTVILPHQRVKTT